MPGEIIHLTKRQELKEYIKTHSAVIIKFTATWCGPCQSIKSHVKEYFEQIKEHFDMVIVDADEGSDICSFCKVRGFPTLHSYINKEMVASTIGADLDDLFTFFSSSFNKLKSS
tara:strand:- start:133 stop:474 length:342 start_codon:yes stop_codon:yes gene_type:complete